MNVKFGETSCMQLLLGGVLWENGIRRVHGCVYVHVCIYACICVCVHVCVRKTWRLLPVIFQNQGMPTKVMPRGVSTGESRKQAQSWSLFKVLVKKGFTGKSFSNKTTKKTRSGTFAESKEQWDVSRHWLVQKCLWANTTPFPRLTHMGGVLLRSQRTGWKSLHLQTRGPQHPTAHCAPSLLRQAREYIWFKPVSLTFKMMFLSSSRGDVRSQKLPIFYPNV